MLARYVLANICSDLQLSVGIRWTLVLIIVLCCLVSFELGGHINGVSFPIPRCVDIYFIQDIGNAIKILKIMTLGFEISYVFYIFQPSRKMVEKS